MIDFDTVRRLHARRIAALALFAIACAVSPSVRGMWGGQPVAEPAATALLSFCLACVALALVIRSAIGAPPRRSGGTAPTRPEASGVRTLPPWLANMPRASGGPDQRPAALRRDS